MKFVISLISFLLISTNTLAVNLLCEATKRTFYSSDGDNPMEFPSDDAFAIVFDDKNNKIIEVTNFAGGQGDILFETDITDSYVYFRMPYVVRSKSANSAIEVRIERVNGKFMATHLVQKTYKYLGEWDGNCKIGKKLF